MGIGALHPLSLMAEKEREKHVGIFGDYEKGAKQSWENLAALRGTCSAVALVPVRANKTGSPSSFLDGTKKEPSKNDAHHPSGFFLRLVDCV